MSRARYLWLDVETTGLGPQSDLLLEVAIWPSRSSNPFDLNPDDRRSWVIHHEGDQLGLRLSPFTWRMHGKSNLLAEVIESRTTLGEVALQLAEVLTEHASQGGTWHLAGNSVHFDRSFLDVHLRGVTRLLHHRILDVSAVTLFAKGALEMPDGEKREPAHRAAADIDESIATLKSLQQRLSTR